MKFRLWSLLLVAVLVCMASINANIVHLSIKCKDIGQC